MITIKNGDVTVGAVYRPGALIMVIPVLRCDCGFSDERHMNHSGWYYGNDRDGHAMLVFEGERYPIHVPPQHTRPVTVREGRPCHLS